MVRRVALAIAKRRGWPENTCDEELAQYFAADARAALEEVREPTEAMIEAGNIVRLQHGGNVTDVHRVMIGAALKDGKP